MRPASQALGALAATDHTVVWQVDVLENGAPLKENIAVESATVKFDRTRAQLQDLSIRLAEPLLLPTSDTPWLTPLGYELKVCRGIRVGQTDELLPMGVFTIKRSTIDRNLLTSVSAPDRSWRISNARFEEPFVVSAGLTYDQAIIAVLQAVAPEIPHDIPPVTHTCPQLIFDVQADPWAEIRLMARSIGYEAYLSDVGAVTMRVEPSFVNPPVASIEASTNLISSEIEWDSEGAYNRVIATSGNASVGALGGPFRGVATDNDPTSPYYYYGRFGRRPRFYASEFIRSNAQAQAAARSVLDSELGVSSTFTYEILPDPRREAGDVVLVSDPQLGMSEIHIVETGSLSITDGSALVGRTRVRPAITEVE